MRSAGARCIAASCSGMFVNLSLDLEELTSDTVSDKDIDMVTVPVEGVGL